MDSCLHRQVHDRGRFYPFTVASSICIPSVEVQSWQKKVFSALKIKSLSSWNAMIAGLAMHGLADKAFTCYERMKKEVFELDEITFVKVVSVGFLSCFQVRDDDSRGSNRICKYCHIATFHNVDPVNNNWYQSMSVLPNTVGLQSCWFGRNW